MCPQVEHLLVLGKYFGALIWCTALYEIWNKMSPMRELLYALRTDRAGALALSSFMFRSSVTTVAWFLHTAVVNL